MVVKLQIQARLNTICQFGLNIGRPTLSHGKLMVTYEPKPNEHGQNTKMNVATIELSLVWRNVVLYHKRASDEGE